MAARTITKSTRSPLLGSATSSAPDISRPETLTSDPSLTCEPTTSPDMPSVISSPASEDGPTLSDLPGGATPSQSGPAPVRVSRFRARDSEKAMPTNATSGPLFTASSPSADLQWCLESRLRLTTDVNGSPEYALIWKTWVMPSGPPICALRASGRRISDKGFTGWPTPMAGTPAQRGYNRAGNTDSSRKTTAILVGWATPKASHSAGGRHPETVLASYRKRGFTTARLDDQVALIRGGPTTSPSAKTALGVLSPEHSRWLMGYPTDWTDSVPTATRSSRRSRPNSSLPTCQPEPPHER